MQTLSFQNLTTIPQLDDNIKQLDISYNKIKDLTNLPSNLEYLNCSHNNITEISNLPATLKTLVCSYNQIKNIVIPPNLKRLNCMYNEIKDIIFTDELEFININHNYLSNISSLPSTLKVLLCSNNLLTFLPSTLPPYLHIINCAYNNLLSLPDIHSNLKEIYFQNNIITKVIIQNNILYYNAQNNPLCKFEDKTPEDDFYYIENHMTCIDYENMEELGIEEYLSYSENNIIIKGPNEKFICYKRNEVFGLYNLPYYQENILDWSELKTPCQIFDLMILKINKETFYKIVPI